jgi:hypothetical protein
MSGDETDADPGCQLSQVQRPAVPQFPNSVA